MKFKNLFIVIIAVLLMAVPTVIFASASAPEYITVTQPATNIVGDISAIVEIGSKAELEKIAEAETKPATAIFSADAELNVVDENGVSFSTVAGVIEALDYSVLPAFRVETVAAAEAVGEWLNENFSDAFLVSSDFEALEAGRAKGTLVTGVLDYTVKYKNKTTLTDEEILALRREVFTREAFVVIMPGKLCTGEIVQKIYNERIGVWARISDEPDETELFGAVVSGATGVISDDVEAIIEKGLSLDENTVTRAPHNTSHAAKQNDAPANTLQAIINAYKFGAAGIEFDIYLCAPEEGEENGKLVLNHDATTSESWSEDGTTYKIAETPWSVLATLKIPYDDTYYSMSLFEDLCKYFAGTDDGVRKSDVSLSLDIKNTDQSNIASLVMEMLSDYGLLDQCTVSSFSTTFANSINDIYDGMPTNVSKNPGLIEDSTADEDMQKIRELCVITNSSIGVSISGVNDVVTEISARAGLHRGIFLGVWGTTTAKMPAYFMEGYYSLSNDYVRNLGNYTTAIKIAGIENEASVTSGESFDISAIRSSYRYADEEVTDFAIEFIEGEELVTLDGTTLTFGDVNGKVTFFVKYTHEIAAREGYYEAMSYTMYSDPITVNVSNFDGAVSMEGFSIRLKEYNGLRGIFKFDKNKDKAFAEQGYTLVEYGALAVPESVYTAAGSVITFDDSLNVSIGYKRPIWSNGKYIGNLLTNTANDTTFALTIVNYQANHASDVYFAAYSVYEDQNGETVVTVNGYDYEEYKFVNLYQLTLDMYINGAINSSNTDDEAVWNTLLTGVVTLSSETDYYVEADIETFGETFAVKEVYACGKSASPSTTVKVTLLNDTANDQWVAVYRGEGTFPASSYDYYNQFAYHKNGASVHKAMTTPVLTSTAAAKVKTVVIDHGITTLGAYAFRSASVRTVVYPKTLTDIEGKSFYYAVSMDTAYEAKATGCMQENEAHLIDLSGMTIKTTDSLFRNVSFDNNNKILLPSQLTSIDGNFMYYDNANTRSVTKIWCEGTKEPEAGVIDLTGAANLASLGKQAFGSNFAKISILKLPDSCITISEYVFTRTGNGTYYANADEIWQATYNADVAAFCETNSIMYCDLSGTEQIDPLTIPGDVEVDDSFVFD